MELGELKSEKHFWNLLGEKKYSEKRGSDSGAIVILQHRDPSGQLLLPIQNSLGSGAWEPLSIRDPQVWSTKDCHHGGVKSQGRPAAPPLLGNVPLHLLGLQESRR